MKALRGIGLLSLGLILVLAAAPPPAAAQIQVFSTGQYGTPETISLAPPGFGSFGGSYLIPDARTADIWAVPATGGPPVSFVKVSGAPSGGLFLPSTGWGDFSGQFLVDLFAIDSNGLITMIDPNGAGLSTTP